MMTHTHTHDEGDNNTSHAVRAGNNSFQQQLVFRETVSHVPLGNPQSTLSTVFLGTNYYKCIVD